MDSLLMTTKTPSSSSSSQTFPAASASDKSETKRLKLSSSSSLLPTQVVARPSLFGASVCINALTNTMNNNNNSGYGGQNSIHHHNLLPPSAIDDSGIESPPSHNNSSSFSSFSSALSPSSTAQQRPRQPVPETMTVRQHIKNNHNSLSNLSLSFNSPSLQALVEASFSDADTASSHFFPVKHHQQQLEEGDDRDDNDDDDGKEEQQRRSPSSPSSPIVFSPPSEPKREVWEDGGGEGDGRGEKVDTGEDNHMRQRPSGSSSPSLRPTTTAARTTGVLSPPPAIDLSLFRLLQQASTFFAANQQQQQQQDEGHQFSSGFSVPAAEGGSPFPYHSFLPPAAAAEGVVGGGLGLNSHKKSTSSSHSNSSMGSKRKSSSSTLFPLANGHHGPQQSLGPTTKASASSKRHHHGGGGGSRGTTGHHQQQQSSASTQSAAAAAAAALMLTNSPLATVPAIPGAVAVAASPAAQLFDDDDWSWHRNPAAAIRFHNTSGGTNKQTPVWKYFVYNKTENLSRCIVGDCTYMLKGPHTSTLACHLKKHTAEHAEFQRLKADYTKERMANAKNGGDQDTTNPSSSKSPSSFSNAANNGVKRQTVKDEHGATTSMSTTTNSSRSSCSSGLLSSPSHHLLGNNNGGGGTSSETVFGGLAAHELIQNPPPPSRQHGDGGDNNNSCAMGGGGFLQHPTVLLQNGGGANGGGIHPMALAAFLKHFSSAYSSTAGGNNTDEGGGSSSTATGGLPSPGTAVTLFHQQQAMSPPATSQAFHQHHHFGGGPPAAFASMMNALAAAQHQFPPWLPFAPHPAAHPFARGGAIQQQQQPPSVAEAFFEQHHRSLAAAAEAVNGGGADLGLVLQQQQQQQKEHRRNHRQNNNSNKRHRHSTVALNGDHLDEAAPEEGADRKQQNTASMPKSKFAKTTEESAVLLNDGEIKSAESGTRKNGLLHHSVHELLLKREDQQSSPSPPPITSTSAGGFFSGGMTTTAAMDLSSTGTYEDPDEEEKSESSSPNIAYRRDEPLVTDYSSNDHLENPENGSKSPLSLETGGLRGSIRVDGEEVSPVAKTPQLQNNNNVDCLWLAIATTFPPTVTEALARNPLFSELFGGTGENSRSVVNEIVDRQFASTIAHLKATVDRAPSLTLAIDANCSFCYRCPMQEEDKERRFRQTVKKEQAIENPEKITANVTEEKEESNVVVSFWALVGRHDDDVLDGTSSSMEETVSAAFSEQRWLLLGIRQLRVHPAARCHSDSVSQSTWSTVEEMLTERYGLSFADARIHGVLVPKSAVIGLPDSMLAEKVVFCSSRPEAALVANHPQSDNNGEGHQDEEEKNSRMEEDSSAEDREGFRNDNFLNNRCFESAQNEPDSEMPPISEGISDFHNTEVVESASSLSNNGTVPLMTKRSPPDTSPLQRLIDDVRRLQPPAEEEVGDFDWQWLERASMLRLNHHHVAERE